MTAPEGDTCEDSGEFSFSVEGSPAGTWVEEVSVVGPVEEEEDSVVGSEEVSVVDLKNSTIVNGLCVRINYS